MLDEEDGPMSEITAVGLDLAKNVFEVHAVDSRGVCVLRRQLSRSRVSRFFAQLPPALVSMEACATAHYWGRQIGALGHRVQLLPPQYVKPSCGGIRPTATTRAALPR